MSINCQLSFSENALQVKGIESEIIEINCEKDVNITPLVSILTELIDKEELIELEQFSDYDGLDEKKKMILFLVEKIITLYNDSINNIGDSEEEVAPIETSSNSNDLPF